MNSKIHVVSTSLLSKEYRYREIDSSIREMDGRVVHSSKVLVPENWSQTAADILSQKYLRKAGVPDNLVPVEESDVYSEFHRSEGDFNPEVPHTEQLGGETSAHQAFHRLAGCWTYWGIKSGYFKNKRDAIKFYNDCYDSLYYQIAAPNSPQWFNTGLNWAYGIKGDATTSPLYYYDLKTKKVEKSEFTYVNPQVHACFIQSISDRLIATGGIMDLAYREAAVFKFGSGSGTNYSKIRGKGEKLSSGGVSSGLMSFLKIGDTAAGSIKSGGTTRRAAKMTIVDIDHPEIEDFIDLKVKEENKVAALVTGSIANRRFVRDMFEAETEEALYDIASDAIDAGVASGLVQRVIQAKLAGTSFDIEAYDTDWQGEAYGTVTGQNANNSVSISDAFMKALSEGASWNLLGRKHGDVMKTVDAKQLWERIAFAAWASADPGVQFSDTMNLWNTCINDERIIATNPCSEYLWFDDTACNLASLNIVAIWERANKEVPLFMDLLGFYSRLYTTVLDISIQMAQFVSHAIAEKTHLYRTTGLGYANIGSFLMRQGFAYGEDDANSVISGITSIMTANAYLQSAKLAKTLEPFPAFERNTKPFMDVMNLHRTKTSEALDMSLENDTGRVLGALLLGEAVKAWENVCKETKFRNAQTVVIAPTGTISLVMDTDTTGMEPDFSLVKHKKLAGGGYLKLVNQAVPEALSNLQYTSVAIDKVVKFISGYMAFPRQTSINPLTGKAFSVNDVLAYITVEDLESFGILPSIIEGIDPNQFHSLAGILTHLEEKTGIDLSLLKVNDEKYHNTEKFIYGYGNIDDCPTVKPEHKSIFACAVSAKPDGVVISPMGHLKAMAAAQPFVSGAISKTINMPATATVKDIQDIYQWSYDNGLKAVSVYRDGSKLSQPLMASVAQKLTKKVKEAGATESSAEIEQKVVNHINIIASRHIRRRLPTKRIGYTQKVNIGGHNLYIRTGQYDDGSLGEIFLDMHKEGAAFRSVMHSFAIAVSIGLQYGVPLEEFCDAFVGSRFEPAGIVKGHANIRVAGSIIDYIFRDLGFSYLGKDDYVNVKPKPESETDLAPIETLETKTATVEVSKSKDGAVSVTSKPLVFAADAVTGPQSIYTGESCSSCNGMRMRPTGTCSTCEECGTTSGCS